MSLGSDLRIDKLAVLLRKQLQNKKTGPKGPVVGSMSQPGLSRCQLHCPGKCFSLQVNPHSQRLESSHTRQVIQIEKLHVIQQAPPGPQEIDVSLHFATLIGVGVHDGHPAGLG